MKRIHICFFGVMFLAMTLSGNISIYADEETSSMMCDGGVVNIGDADVDVRNNCGEPNTQGVNQWVYNQGPGESYTVIFEEGKVARILEND
jgi:hypothetical protein